MCFINLLKIPIFTETARTQSEKNKKKIFSQKKSGHQATQITQNQGPFSSPLSRKNAITFCSISAFFLQERGVVKGSRIGVKI